MRFRNAHDITTSVASTSLLAFATRDAPRQPFPIVQIFPRRSENSTIESLISVSDERRLAEPITGK